MKKLIFGILLYSMTFSAQGQGNDLDKGQIGYIPSAENLKNREWFRDAHFGMFIH